MTVVKDKSGVAVLDPTQPWLSMESCPRGQKVQLLGQGGSAVYGMWDGKDQFWKGWAPLPKVVKDKNGQDYYPRSKEEWARDLTDRAAALCGPVLSPAVDTRVGAVSLGEGEEELD